MKLVVPSSGSMIQTNSESLAPYSLPDGIVGDARMVAQDATVHVHDLARLAPLGPQLVDQGAIVAVGYEADVLAVRLGRDAQAQRRRHAAHLGLFQIGQGKAEVVQLVAGRGEKEVGLVARMIDRLPHLGLPIRARGSADVVARRHRLGPEVAGDVEKIAELDGLVAADARHRRLTGQIAVGKLVDHRVAELRFIIEDVVGDAQHLGSQAGVVNVLTGAAGPLLLQGRAVIIELQSYADDVIARLVQQGGDDGGVHPARHRRDHARSGRQADRRARGLDRRIHVVRRRHGGDVGDRAKVLGQGHGRYLGLERRDFEA